MTNQFKNETEKIHELKTCLEEAYNILDTEDDIDKVRTLIRDVLARYNENKKFLTADVKREGIFEFLND